jgi:PAS domain S-box-containing protein
MIIGRDITERKKQEGMLAEAERIALIGSWEWNILHNQATFSQQLYRIMETCPQQGGLASILDLVPAHEQSGFKEKIEWALKGNNLSFEFRNTDKSGVNKYFHIRGIVIFSENGVPAKISGTVQDVTEQKLVELKLQETVERYTSLKKYNHDAVVSLDLDGNIINGNMMFQELTGYPIHEILGQSFSTFSGRRDIKEILGKSLKDVSAEKLIDKIIHKSGKQSEVLTTIAPIIINNENVGYYILAKDITEQKKLIIAKEAAESTNKAKSEFLAMMSHEIRTPMNGVIGMTDLLMETTVLDEQQKEYLEIIRKSGDTLLSIINDILDFSKIDSGKTDLLEEAFDVRDCIFEAVDVLSPKAREKKLDISFSLSPDVPAVLVGDSMRLKQILMNLIGNAIKFTKDGGIQVSVKKQAGNDQKVKLRFGVKDTGIGIDMNKHDQLFQPFYQVDNFMTRRSEGTGLGLAICKKLVNLMGGEIWVETTDEPGATFIFTVMLKEEKSNKALLMDINNSEGTKTKRQLKVMIAEDNKINQVVLIKMLENQGHSIRIAENGHEVIKLIQEEAFDVIFMDVHMPMMNGLEATAAIKDMFKADECPVIIAVTANALKGDREKCLAAGMDEYISKPINNKAVFEIIQKFFG